MFDIQYDPVCKHIYSKSVGFHTVEQARQFTAQVRAASQVARADCGRALMLMNSLDAVVLSQEVIAELAKNERVIQEMLDRIAVVFTSTLARMQSERMGSFDQVKVFVSMLDALTWLHSDGPARDWTETAKKYCADKKS